MFAVKANPSPEMLQIVWNGGIRGFDVASIQEVRNVRSQFPEATINFMNPIKNKHAIREAFLIHNVTTFALDSLHELDKILRATEQVDASEKRLTLCVRMEVESRSCKLPLASKFGVKGEAGQHLLLAARQIAYKLGVCFHVGSQTMDPEDFTQAPYQAHEMILHAGVEVDMIDVGGGFPAKYPGMEPPPLRDYFNCIHRAAQVLPLLRGAEIWAEPGRALCADFNSLIVQVEEVRGRSVYGNDGIWGNLSDAGRL